MTRFIVAGAQIGAIRRVEGCARVAARIMDLLVAAAGRGAGLVAFPELALTTFFPRWFMEDQAEVDAWSETAMPDVATAPLFWRARALGVAITFGYAELTPEGRRFNTSVRLSRTLKPDIPVRTSGLAMDAGGLLRARSTWMKRCFGRATDISRLRPWASRVACVVAM